MLNHVLMWERMWERLMALTVRKVETAKAGKHGDGKGLFLLVKETGARSWVLRYQINGRRRDLGLGAFPEVTLAEAREKIAALRREIKNGVDPLSQRKQIKIMTFQQAAEFLIESKKSGWKNAKHAAQWKSTLETYVYSKIGSVNVAQIATADVTAILTPIWNDKTETANRVRQRIEAVLDYATAMRVRTGENPARWRGHLDHLLPKPSKVKPVRHYEAFPYEEAPQFMRDLEGREGVSPRALRFTILTAARSGEVRGAIWKEIDLKNNLWIIPAERMKAGKEQRIPLTPAALACLDNPKNPNDFIFASDAKPGKALSDMSLTAVMRRMGRGE